MLKQRSVTVENEIQIFENVEFGKVRTMVINDEPLFVGKMWRKHWGILIQAAQ